MTTKDQILSSTIAILAREGYAGTSMRQVAATIGREPSIIYAHFTDKEELLRAVRFHIIRLLDEQQTAFTANTAQGMMHEVVRFQLENRLQLVALLQYFMSMRQDFPREDGGYVPPRAYEHMTKVLQQGIQECRYHSDDVDFDAKTMVHLVNGFLMEYFDRKLSDNELSDLTSKIADRLENLVLIRNKPGRKGEV